MGRKAKIDARDLQRLIREGKNKTEIARHFGVSAAAVGKMIKQCKIVMAREVTIADRATPQIIEDGINIMAQLRLINTCAIEILDGLMGNIRGGELTFQGRETKGKKRQGKTIDISKPPSSKDPRELALRAMETIKRQLQFQMEIFQVFYDAEAFKEFKTAFLDVIGRVAPEVRDSIIAELQRARLLPTGF